MDTSELILVSVDDHVIEPRTMFDAHIPEKYRDRAPYVGEDEHGNEYWQFEDERSMNVGLNAVAGCPPEEYGLNPTRFDQMRPGCYDVHERVRDMNANGVLGSMNFPTFPHFCGQLFARAKDKDLAINVVRAYNDWHIDEWAGAYPDRFIPLGITPFWDPQLMADEVRRISAKGCNAITFSENPEKLGVPGLHSDHWDPVWQACVDTATVVCMHIGSSSSMIVTSMDAPADVSIAITPMNALPRAQRSHVDTDLREVPSIEDRHVRRWNRLDSVCARAHGLRLRTSSRVDGCGFRWASPERRVPRAHHHVLHR